MQTDLGEGGVPMTVLVSQAEALMLKTNMSLDMYDVCVESVYLPPNTHNLALYSTCGVNTCVQQKEREEERERVRKTGRDRERERE